MTQIGFGHRVTDLAPAAARAYLLTQDLALWPQEC
jgi:hypothetical protein